MATFYTFNAKGMRDLGKQSKIFKYFEHLNNSIIFFQETHYCEKIDRNQWQQRWKGESIWAGNSSNARCTGILFTKDLNIEILDKKNSQKGEVHFYESQNSK